MFVAPELFTLVESGPWTDVGAEKRFGRLRADLDEFTRGAILTVTWEPFEARDAYFGRLGPLDEEVWDVRSRDPSPAIRVLGSFADTDLFMGLVWGWRKEWGDGDSRAWRDAREQSKAAWRNLFPTYQPIHGDKLSDYLTNAVLV